MVLLSVVESVAGKLPVVFHREPFSPEKYAFANGVIAERGYAVYDYAPSGTAILKAGGHIEVMNAYQLAPGKFLDLPTGIVQPEPGQPFLCGYSDIYNKPLGAFGFPWDMVFMGHKSSDVDPLRGPVPLLVDVVVNEGAPTYSYPLRNFTDDDVWLYTEEHGLPVHATRYNRDDGYREHSSKDLNPDYFRACTRCMDPDEPLAVVCPKLGAEITNRSSQLRRVGTWLPSYVDQRRA